MARKNCVLFMWFHIKLCWKQTNIPILLVFIPELISDLCSFTFSIVSYETINPLKVMFLSLSPIFLTHSHIFFYSILLFSKNLCYLNCRLSSLTNLYLIQIFASILDTGIHTAHWPWALESKTLGKVFPACGSLGQMLSFKGTSCWELLWLQPVHKSRTAQGAISGVGALWKRRNISSCCTWFLFLSSSAQLLEESIGQQ